jgi:hypothetical protein
MRGFLFLTIWVFAVGPALALEHATELPASSGPVITIDNMMAALAVARAQEATISCYGYDYQLLYPIAINAPGKNGTFYKTDYFVINERPFDQDVLIGFLPAGVSAAGTSAQRFMLRASTAYAITDFLGTGTGRLNKSGVGSLLLTAVMSGTNTIDTGGLVFGASAIWTNQPGSTGTTSFYSPAVSPGIVHGSSSALAAGIRQNTNFRSNFGVVNLDIFSAHTFTVDVLGGGSPARVMVTVPPLSMQYAAVPDITPSDTGYIVLKFTPTIGFDFQWNSFGTTADNITGDARLSNGVQFTF